MKRLVLGTFVLAAVMGCSDGVGPTPQRPATIEADGLLVDLSVPDTVPVGQEFDVMIFGYDGGCWGQGGVEARASGLRAVVEPFVVRRDGNCGGLGRFDEYVASLRFEVTGDATVTFEGLTARTDPNGADDRRPLSVDATVVVR